MKLISEVYEKVNFLVEEKEGKKDFFIEGTFMVANRGNKNNRIYKKNILEREVERYTKEHINENRAFGELGHPQGPTINLERTAILIKSLKSEGDNFIGKAKVMDTPYGNIVKNLMMEGATLGVSSRGMGSLKMNDSGLNEVQDDFYLATAADVVADPSAPGAFVRGIMEGVEWVWDNGVLKPQEVEEMKKTIQKASSRNLEEAQLKVFKQFIKSL
jgi:hypothetical protein